MTHCVNMGSGQDYRIFGIHRIAFRVLRTVFDQPERIMSILQILQSCPLSYFAIG